MRRNNEKQTRYVPHHSGTCWRPVKKKVSTASVVFFFFLLVSALVFLGWIDISIFAGTSSSISDKPIQRTTGKSPKEQEFPLKCTKGNKKQTCPKNYYPTTTHNPDRPISSSNKTCPSYFRWIHEDLRHWKHTGITRTMVKRARKTAHFRLVIVKGKAYVEKYRESIQTRDMFSLWGILQLLRLYPGRLPDLELMFDCDDRPVVPSNDFLGPKAGPPPLFRYCSDWSSLDIVFPDWSFWGWAEINIKPWKSVLEDIKQGNTRTKWKDRIPYAYWRGNPSVAPTRNDLLKCNVSDKNDWNTHLYIQDWVQESEQGYKQSNLEDQCTHRYKIYIEGWAWSVSEKYILACDSMTLLIRPQFYDFFIRGMVPLEHYWPIRDNSKCTSLKFAVEWGNNHTQKSALTGNYFFRTFATTVSPKKSSVQVEYPFKFNCSNLNLACPTNYPVTIEREESSPVACPEYMRWIHEDLWPWKSAGITRDMVESGRVYANFRLVIVKGKAYVEKYKGSYQTRDVFTIWGILQLLRLYPGKVPDLELMFWCGDETVIKKRDHQGPKATSVPPVFHYCNDDESLDIVFPDWSFWGWPEIDIKPWRTTLEALKEGNKRIEWKDRKPYAFWKGNPHMSRTRMELMKCRISDKHDWNVHLYIQDWGEESKQGFKNSKLEDQCTHRYKIYIEGSSWSVSEKYILACNSMTLLLMPQYHEFFTRSLVPMQHYWPIKVTDNICRDLKLAVEWGNNHTDKAQAIGEAASKFIQENLKMDFIYDYMFHLLSEYSKLLKFEPTIPLGALEVCSETMACLEGNKFWRIKNFMVESMVKSPRDTLPCTMPPPL